MGSTFKLGIAAAKKNSARFAISGVLAVDGAIGSDIFDAIVMATTTA
jgi:hypothetical protein